MRKYLLLAILAGLGLFVNHTYHNKELLKRYVKQRVVYITNDSFTTGGTGSQMQAPSGAEYIITNAHVCNGVMKDGSVRITLNDGTHLQRRVIEVSRDTDLCVVEPVPGLAGLSIANDMPLNELAFAVGHPELMPTVMSEGELLAEEEIVIPDHYTSEEHPCSLPKEKDFNGVCADVTQGVITNIVIFPGNSGSPVVNYSGQVIAVVFAGNGSTNYGVVIPLKLLKELLARY